MHDTLSTRCVKADLEPIFIFDGPYLPLKIPTVLSRFGESAANNSAFMRSSSRYKPGFQISMGVFPPLLYDCTLEALRQCNVKVVIEEIEADSAVAEIADRMGGWAVSNDSDFFILCARGTQCRGYVPIDSIEYLVKPAPKDQPEASQSSASAANFDDDGFAPLAKAGEQRAQRWQSIRADRGSGSDPRSTSHQRSRGHAHRHPLHLLLVHQARSRSRHPILHALPLAALVGNDYTASIQRRILDPALPFGPQRITFIANAIKTETLRMASVGGSRTRAVFAPEPPPRPPLARGSAARFWLERSICPHRRRIHYDFGLCDAHRRRDAS